MFQDPATPVFEAIINLHHDLMFFITFILFFVIIVLYRVVNWYNSKSFEAVTKRQFVYVVHGTVIEII